MKRSIVLRALALALVLMMTAALFAACGQKDEKVILGKWETVVDLSKLGGEELEDLTNDIGELDLSGITLKMSVEFKEDGTYTTDIDKASADAALGTLVERMTPAITETLKKSIAESMGMDASSLTDEDLDSFMSMAGLGSLEDFVGSITEEIDSDKLIEESVTNGRYQLKDGKLYTTDSVDEQIGEDSDVTLYQLTPTTLTVTPENEDDVPESMKGMLPLTFTKLG